jgi:cell fate (sporulation/competence/biofilm development) regulator YlbF (YheA/YmcA/DUF963 family)
MEVNMKILMSIALVLATFVSVTVGQRRADVDRVGEKIATQLESRLSGWRHKPVEPFGPGSNIVVQSWSLTNRTVKVAVAIHESAEDAKAEIRNFLQFKREPQELRGFGDEAFVTDPDGSDIVLRRGRYVIYISSLANVENDSDARKLSKVEREARQKTEVQRIGKEFAKQLSSIELQ